MIVLEQFNVEIQIMRNEKRIKHLEEENSKLKENYYKDNELQKMKKSLEEMREDYYYRGLPISEKEQNAIEEWKKNHDEEVHGYTKEMRMKAEGVSGCRYLYSFVPTALGVSGTIKCNCGAEFEFQKIG